MKSTDSATSCRQSRCRQRYCTLTIVLITCVMAGFGWQKPVSAGGAWYVGPAGSDVHDCLALESACKTIGAAIGKAVSGDVINVAAGVYFENLDISDKNLSIRGLTDTPELVTIDGNASGAVLRVLSGMSVTISGLTIQNGTGGQGGGIGNWGSLTLNNVVIRSNRNRNGDGYGGGIANHGTMSLSEVSVRDNSALVSGGGIYNSGSMTLTGGQIIGNTAWYGGGISNYGSSTVDSTQVQNNTALLVNSTQVSSSYGGGVYNEGDVIMTRTTLNNNVARAPGTSSGYGGGMFNAKSASLTNSTISGNSARNGGGITQYASGATTTLINVTVAGEPYNTTTETGGVGIVLRGGSMVLRNTLVSSSSADNTCLNTVPVTSLGNNLERGTTCGLSQASDQVNTDPRLGPLQSNRGSTPTHALLSASPAIDAGTNTGCPTTDQRAILRPQDGNGDGTKLCDIGAYEQGVILPAPTLASLLPTSITAAGRAFTLTVTGTNFTSSSIVQWNGSARSTKFISSTRLTALISTVDIATAGTARVTIFTPGPGGGTSNIRSLSITSPVGSNLLTNASFESDGNNDSRPDGWTSDIHATRTSKTVHGGTYSLKLAAVDDASYAISQVVPRVVAGTTYNVSSWVNIPSTTDTFLLQVEVQWRNATNSLLGTSQVKTYAQATTGWNLATAAVNAPPAASSALVRMVVTSLNGTIYVDDLTFQVGNLLINSGFELDANTDGRPDLWTSDRRVTRVSSPVHGGSFAVRHYAVDDSSYSISQRVSNLLGGTTYNVSGWVNIPTTPDAFLFQLEVVWRNINDSPIGTNVIKTYTRSTTGWTLAAAPLVAPAGTTNAEFRMLVSSLNATIYVDDLAFQVRNQVNNGGFELDSNSDSTPDNWSVNSWATRAVAAKRSGYFGLQHMASTDTSYTVSQGIWNLSGGTVYSFAAWVNVPPTTDTFTFTVQIEWRNASNIVLGTSIVKTFSETTGGWIAVTKNVAAPVGATNATVRMVVSSLNGTVYVDDIVLRP